ncbi:hypothetical protein AAFC00_002900 [Neodothiora populina]|uniref:Derlin n=1 Tax=Neodothiora populina TaxID=2781224 RepID=A0ABR3P9C5_9PEZI
MSAMDMFWTAPPVTRTITAAAAVTSVLVYTGILNAGYIVFIPYKIFKLWLPELWRLPTSFLLTSPKLGMLLDPYFLFTYGKALEVGSARFTNPADFLVFIVFVCSVISILAGLWLSSFVFLQPLILALAYLYAQENPEQQMTFYIVTFRVKFLPYCMLLMTLVMDSPTSAMNQATGLVAAHLYDFLTRIWPAFGRGSNPIKTPQVLQRWFDSAPGAPRTTTHGTAFQARPSAGQAQPAARASTGGWTSGFSGNSWGGRGPGHRLGGD